jgi:N-acyl-D-amino-acid deacylase
VKNDRLMFRVRLAVPHVALLLAARGLAGAAPDLTEFDRSITSLMAAHHVPGAAIAVARGGKLVVARAYGLADRERQTAVQPDSLFRIASVSKPLTAVAILKLVEEGRLDLDAKAFSILDRLQPPNGRAADPRLRDITIRQLLQHTGGWDRDISGDPIDMGVPAARALNVAAPVSPTDLVRYMMGQPLDFTPGERFAYSNLGYVILGRVIEAVTRMPYEEYVKMAVLAPAGIRRTRLGRSTLAGRAEGEVKYYDLPGNRLVWTSVRGGDPVVPAPYANPMETWEACGAWISSAVDLVRFALSLDPKSGHTLLLQPGTLERMLGDRVSMPPPSAGMDRNFARFYSLGWLIDVHGEGEEPVWAHMGAGLGTSAVLIHRPEVVYAVLFNSGPWSSPSWGDLTAVGDAHRAFTAALDSIKEWPEEDLFALHQ